MVMEGFLNYGDVVQYPLTDGEQISSSGTPGTPIHIRQGLADAAFILGPRSNFNAATYGVYLHSIVVNAGAVSYDFRCDCMPLYRWLLVFPAGTGFGCTAYADCSLIIGGTEDPGYGTAWATAGILDDLAALPDNVYVPVDETFVEPARLQDASNSYVYTVNIGNIGRPCPGNCCSSSSGAPPDVFVVHRNIVSDILFKEGYNCSIRVKESDNSIEIGAELGAGIGPACNDLIIYDDDIQSSEVCPESASCDGYIKSINGLTTSGALTFIGGPGVVVTPNQALHRVTVRTEENRLCASSSSFSV